MRAVARATTPSRTGAILAELAVALLLAGVAAAIGGGILVAAERRTRRDASSDRGGQSVRDVARLLTTEITAALPDSVIVRGDTALDLYAHVGVSVLCAQSAGVAVLPGATTSAALPFSIWRQQPEADDMLAAWDTTSGGGWRAVVVDSVAPAPDGGGCGTASGFRTVADSQRHVATMRLFHTPAIPVGVPTGAPVRLYRRVRWVLYRGSDRVWALGLRRCPRDACGTVQPVAGPFASAADSGLRFAIREPGVVSVSIRAAERPGAVGLAAVLTIGIRGARRAAP